MQAWQYRRVPIRFQLGDRTLFTVHLWLQTREVGLDDGIAPVAESVPPAEELRDDSQGFLVRSLPVQGRQPALRRQDGYLCYVPSQHPRYYIDMRQSFEAYKDKFSSKTRSTLQRKIRKYAEHCGGQVAWKVYRTPEEMQPFFGLARTVSRMTYQERLLDAGLPDSREFLREMERLAGRDCARGFILFHHDRPVSYLYCPVSEGILIYAYLGYDPEYMGFSVGTILQWLALEHLFDERAFRFFDFTEGESAHKKLFATHSVLCANVFFLRSNLRNRLLLQSQGAMDRISRSVGDGLDRLGLKARVKKIMRFGA